MIGFIEQALAERVVEPWVIDTMKERFTRARMAPVHTNRMGIYSPTPTSKFIAERVVEESLRDLAAGRLERTVLELMPTLALGSVLVKANDV